MKQRESTIPGFAAPGMFRIQGFSPSVRLTPPAAAQPCFMLNRSWGFALPEYQLPYQLYALSDACPPLLLQLEESGDSTTGQLRRFWPVQEPIRYMYRIAPLLGFLLPEAYSILLMQNLEHPFMALAK